MLEATASTHFLYEGLGIFFNEDIKRKTLVENWLASPRTNNYISLQDNDVTKMPATSKEYYRDYLSKRPSQEQENKILNQDESYTQKTY